MNIPAPSGVDQIALNDIAPTLRQMWRDSADDEHPVTHVRTLNLVIFVPADQHSATLQRTIDELAVQHPGRTIALIVHNESHPTYAQASLACRLGNGDKHICGEQITLHGGDGGAPLFSTMASLLLPDLPVFVWWLGDPPFSSPLFDNITELADRMLIDARTWRSSDATLQALASLVEQTPRFACTDLLWTALTSWRHSIAQCFDLPASQQHLPHLERITITHGPDAHDRVAAQLIVGWLGSRLGWRMEGPTLHCADGTPIALTLHEQNDPGIHAVDLRSATASFAITSRLHSTCADVQIAMGGAAPMQFVVPRKTPPLPALVGEELMLLNHDAGYEAALVFAAQLAAQ
jgi:glucose-6-phosphate dehydrogenase assembly protein OpcA